MVARVFSDAATVARLIPRVNVWAVTGTPVRRTCEALFGLLTFLRLYPLDSKLFRQRLTHPEFQGLIRTIALRHTKDQVRNELNLPPQRRVVVTLGFSRVEEEGYKAAFGKMVDELRALGVKVDDLRTTSDVDLGELLLNPLVKEKMRYWMERLRGLCVHPQVGGRNKVALGKRGGIVLESMADGMCSLALLSYKFANEE
jgi:E3 ubiquitin-protein ligase SHPRH